MSVTGVVTSVSPKRAGDTLAVDTLATDTALLLDDAGDFSETFEVPRFLVIGDESTPRQYVAVQNDPDAGQESVTLAAAVGAVYEAGLPVSLWDPAAEAAEGRAVEYVAWVRQEGQDPFPANIPYDTVPVGKEYTLEGASVGVDEDPEHPGEWRIVEVYGREPVLDLSMINRPRVVGWLNADRSVPNGADTIILWDAAEVYRFAFSAASAIVQVSGLYLVVCGIHWAINATGRRQVLPRYVRSGAGSSEEGWRDSRPAEQTAAMSSLTVSTVELLEGDHVDFYCFQNSGAALSLLGTDINFCRYSITWLGPA